VATERLLVSQFPSAVHTEVADRIAQSTTALNRITRQGNREHSELIGSGTFVFVGGRHCILTAHHVAVEIKGDLLSLMTSFDGKMRRHAFPIDTLIIHPIARGQDDSTGPDLALVVLPEASLGYLRAEKTFFNIDKRAPGYLKKPVDEGFWFACGVVYEGMQELGTVDQFEGVKGYWGLCGIGSNPKELSADGYDYLDIDVSYNPPSSDLPASFQGLSGGGVWQVLFKRDAEGTIMPIEYILSGVVFYETAMRNNQRNLRCHGGDTVYRAVPNFMSRQNLPI
jgi:hypothetical protein